MGLGERCRKPEEAWLSLAQAVPALKDPNRYFWIDDRFDYEEERIITLGRNERSILVVVSAEKPRTENNDEEIIRIISVRQAVGSEEDSYYLGRA
jgi:uncharacterized DUF497 family protein